MELVGCLHVHTTHSDGTAAPSEVIGLASAAGLDFLGINDHMSLAARDEIGAGWHGGLLALTGAELNDDSGGLNHLLVYGIDELPPDGLAPADYPLWVRARGGLSIAAHPREKGSRLPFRTDSTRALPWTEEPRPGLLDGVEIWNYMSQWKDGLSPLRLVRSLRSPDRSVVAPDGETVGFWRRCRCAGIGGVDAHCFRPGFGLRVFPYPMLFDRIRTHVLLDPSIRGLQGRKAEQALLEAMLGPEGLTFVSNRLAGDARGFRAFRRSDGGECGSLELCLPLDADDCVLDTPQGRKRMGSLPAGGHLVALPGQERCGGVAVELWRDGRLWIWCGLA
ncbi:PHP domain-containing protein [Candidatus Fermentibacterales bacterium]|nr:PHP domain-containing protein [Candidatus Fermentibacterales bacterium]